MPDLRFDGRVAIITGAGGGLGRSHALELARRRAKVVVNDVGHPRPDETDSRRPAQRVVDEITEFGGEAIANYDSVATAEGGQSIVDTALEAFGHVDIVVNNAGILRDKAFHHLTAEMVEAVLDVHLKGAFNVSLPAFKVMRGRNYGRFISTTSASGLFGNFGQANYGAAKAGLVGLTRVLALEGAGHNIKANAIAPIAATQMTEHVLGDLLEKVSPTAVSPVVAYLAHETCAVNGHVYSVSGGRVARIMTVETDGLVFSHLTAENVRDNLATIDQLDASTYHEPMSLSEETTLIAKALSDAT